MTMAETVKKLSKLGYSPSRWKLEEFELLAQAGPKGAFDAISCYRIVDKKHKPVRGGVQHVWKPVVAMADRLDVGPSPELLEVLLDTARFFERPKAFSVTLLGQLHNFAMFRYQEFPLDLESTDVGDGELVFRGTSQKKPHDATHKFTTRVVRGSGAAFDIVNPRDRRRLRNRGRTP